MSVKNYDDHLPQFGTGLKRDYSESRLHFAVVDYLNGEIRNGKNIIRAQSPFPGLMFAHFANEIKDETEAYWAKRKGLLPGAPDIIMWDILDDVLFSGAIELKRASGGTQSGAQRDFQYKFESKGGKYAICRKVSEVRDAIIAWGLTCKNMNCLEPKLSHSELLAVQAEMYKR